MVERAPAMSHQSDAVSLRRHSWLHAGWRRNIALVLITLDALSIFISIAAAYLGRFSTQLPDEHGGSTIAYVGMCSVLVIGWLCALVWYQTYNVDTLAIGSEEYRSIVRATVVTFGIFAIVSVLLRWYVARGFLALALPLGVLLLLAERSVIRGWLLSRRRRGMFVDGVIIVGSPQEVRFVAEGIARNPGAGLIVRAVATDTIDVPTFELANGVVVPQVGRIRDVADSVARFGANTVIIAGHNRVSRLQLREIGWALEGRDIRLALATRMTDVAGPRIHWRPIEGLPLMSVEVPRYTGMKFTFKRIFDFVTAAILIVVLAPVLLAVAVAVRVDSKGPILFRQTRVGVNGTLFKMTKFRSMVIDAEERLAKLQRENQGSGVLFKMKDDPRITRVGKFIRRYSLDELPQLFDVLVGNMSLVGPRPPLPKEVEAYEHHVHRRLNVKPGITGPWQVGGRSNLSWEESVRKDLYYVENWSLSGDLVILLKTLRAVLKKDGAY